MNAPIAQLIALLDNVKKRIGYSRPVFESDNRTHRTPIILEVIEEQACTTNKVRGQSDARTFMVQQGYSRYGFSPPWVAHRVIVDNKCIAICGFTSPPRSGEAHCVLDVFSPTFNDYASATVSTLVKVARSEDPNLTVSLRLSLHSPNHYLHPLGFMDCGYTTCPIHGDVQEWKLPSYFPL